MTMKVYVYYYSKISGEEYIYIGQFGMQWIPISYIKECNHKPRIFSVFEAKQFIDKQLKDTFCDYYIEPVEE